MFSLRIMSPDEGNYIKKTLPPHRALLIYVFHVFRFCPSVFFYLVTIVPCVWILELDMLSARLAAKAMFDEKVNMDQMLQNKMDNLTLFHGVSGGGGGCERG